MATAIILILIVVASVLFNWLSPWTFTPLASNWGAMDTTLNITLIITGVVFIAITLFMALAIIKYRHREGARAHYQPENKKLEWWLIGLTSVGIVAMLAPGLVVYSDFVNVPEDADVVEVVGQQWQWSYRYPGEDGELGTADIRHVTVDNPVGVNPDDPKGQDDVVVTGAALHLPLDRPVKVLLRSKDVLHDFYVPHFRAKMDLVPGLVSYFWFTPTQSGKYEVLCAELCGVGHYNMRSHVVVQPQDEFHRWLGEQPTFSEKAAATGQPTLSPEAQRGRQVAEQNGCFACHSTDGSRMVGPTWKDTWGSTEALADGSEVTVDEEYIKESVLKPNAKVVKGFPPAMQSYQLSEEDLAALAAYIRSLSGEQGGAPSAAADDPAARGRRLAESRGCFACHSTDGSRLVGPTWQGLWGRQEELTDGSTVTVDEEYFRESISKPNAKVVKGFPPAMQSYDFTEEEMEALLAYVRKDLSGE